MNRKFIRILALSAIALTLTLATMEKVQAYWYEMTPWEGGHGACMYEVSDEGYCNAMMTW